MAEGHDAMRSEGHDAGVSEYPPATVGVIGGGRMGSGIAHGFLMHGSQVGLVEADPEACRAARARVASAVEVSLARAGPGTASSIAQAAGRDELLKRLQVGTDIDDIKDMELVVEAVPEDLALKQETLAAAEHTLAPDGVLATNTSSLSIDELATALREPGRFLGLHFFNPVPASRLVEVVRGSRTSTEVLERSQRWVRALGKTPVTVRDSPGFASSRLGIALGLEAIRMVEEAVADAEAIDAAMTLGYKHPIGPLRLTDLVGLDVRLAIAEYLAERLGERFEPPDLLRRMVDEGKLGRKTGEGFYRW